MENKRGLTITFVIKNCSENVSQRYKVRAINKIYQKGVSEFPLFGNNDCIPGNPSDTSG